MKRKKNIIILLSAIFTISCSTGKWVTNNDSVRKAEHNKAYSFTASEPCLLPDNKYAIMSTGISISNVEEVYIQPRTVYIVESIRTADGRVEAKDTTTMVKDFSNIKWCLAKHIPIDLRYSYEFSYDGQQYQYNDRVHKVDKTPLKKYRKYLNGHFRKIKPQKRKAAEKHRL